MDENNRYGGHPIWRLHCFLDKIVNISSVTISYLIGLFMLLLFIQVVLRFVFKSPIYGIDELVTALMVWSMALGNAVVYWKNEHAVIEFFMKKAPNVFRKFMHHLSNLIVIVISVVYVSGGITLFKMQNKLIPLGGLPFTKAYYYALPVIVMGVVMVILSLIKSVTYILLKDEKLLLPNTIEGGGYFD